MALTRLRTFAPASESRAPAKRPLVGRREPRALAAVLAVATLLYLVAGLRQAVRDDPTVDEAVDVSSGVATLVRHDLRLNPEHAPLPKVLSAIPALLAQPVVPDGAAWRDGDWFAFTDDFLRANRDAGRLDRVLFLARLVPLAEGLACAWVMYTLGERLFGRRAATVSAALWLTTPVVVGLSHFAGVDIAFALATLLVARRTLAFVDAPRLANAVRLGAVCAVALLTRHSALSLWVYAVAVVAAVSWRTDRRAALRGAATVLLVGFVGVWLGIRLLAPAGASDVARARSASLVADASAQSVMAKAALAVPFPSQYRAGLAYLVVTSDDRPAYLFGQAWTGSRVWYFPGSLLAKLPFGAMAAVVLLPIGMRRSERLARRRAALAVAGPVAVSLLFLLGQPLNLGVRYLMPSVALLLVLGGSSIVWITTRPRRAFAAVALAAQVLAMVGAGDHSLAWTAPPFRPAYRWVSDSNLDYGQDLGRVASWAESHPGAWVALLRPRGADNPAGTRELRGTQPVGVAGWVAVSATRLTVLDRDELSWLRAYCPVGDIAGSVLLYRLAPVPDSTPGPTMPAASCSGQPFSTRR